MDALRGRLELSALAFDVPGVLDDRDKVSSMGGRSVSESEATEFDRIDSLGCGVSSDSSE